MSETLKCPMEVIRLHIPDLGWGFACICLAHNLEEIKGLNSAAVISSNIVLFANINKMEEIQAKSELRHAQNLILPYMKI